MKKSPAVDEPIRQFEVHDGGKEALPITMPAHRGPRNHDWLRELPIQSRFLSKLKMMRGARLDNFGLLALSDKAALLYNFLPTMGDTTHIWVETATFSRDNDLVEVLKNSPQEENANEEHHLSIEEPRQEHD